MGIIYRLDIVGGEFDGSPGLAWLDDGEHPLPDAIYVGVCGRGRDCGASACSPAKAHVSYWTAEELGRPPAVLSYAKQEEFVEREASGELRGRGVYAVGGLLDPRNFGEAARVPEGAEPVVLAGSTPDLFGAPVLPNCPSRLVPAGR
jgi:hypothetical protein